MSAISLRRPLVLLALALHAAAAGAQELRARIDRSGRVPAPESLRAEVRVAGRSSRLVALDVVDIGATIPPTFSRHLLRNTDGFIWYVSRHYALKTDLPAAQAQESLLLLELAHPHLAAIFGQEIAALRDRRMAFVFGATRQSLERAMVSDQMHVLRQGGITQEGFWSAYQYASNPYHSRYIILHEAVHLYQYCLAGTTRQFHGFFIEGVADLFSSHVYDPDTKQLTLNVLDRAPVHNHFAKGLEEWRQSGRPALHTLHEAVEPSRGISVLLCAFFQRNPEWEQKWRLYVDQILRTSQPGDDPRARSARLIAALYGDWEALDRDFAAWVEPRQATFTQVEWGFDQLGDALVSYAPRNGAPAAMLLQPPPGGAVPLPGDPFVRDYPRADAPDWAAAPGGQATDVVLACGMDFADAQGQGVAGWGLGWLGTGPAVTVTISNAQWLVLDATSAGGERLVCAMSPGVGAACGLRLTLGTNALHAVALRLAAPDTRVEAGMPLDAALARRLRECPAAVLASRRGLAVTPYRWSLEAAPSASAAATGDVAATRFAAASALGRIYRAAWRLGTQAPTVLLIARNMLLAAAEGHPAAALAAETQQADSFWRGLAEAVNTCGAPEPLRRAALADLSGATLDLIFAPRASDGGCPLVAVLRGAAVGELRGPVVLRGAAGETGACVEKRHTIRLPPSERAERTLMLPAALAQQGFTAAATAELTWQGLPLHLEARRVGIPGITHWQVLGPFEGGAVFADTPFPPEEQPPDLDAVFVAADGTRLMWQPVIRPETLPADADHLLHFAGIFNRQANFCSAYALTRVDTPRAIDAVLALGVADGLRVWVNGQLVLADLRERDWAPCNLRLPIRLEAGENRILVKSIHGQGLWFLSARLESPDGQPLEGVRYR